MGKKIKQKSVILLTFFLGIVISINIKSLNPSNVFVSLKSISELKNQIELENIEINNTKRLINERKDSLLKYENEMKGKGSINDIVKEEVTKYKTIAGLTSLEGEGIIVELRDSEKELKDNESPNDIIVHDMDILQIVNELKIGGAEAISINGERIISSSEIKCSGPTITINGSTYGQPYMIMAIGDKKQLEAQVKAPNSYTNLLKELSDVQVKCTVSSKIMIPKYYKDTDFKYLKEGD